MNEMGGGCRNVARVTIAGDAGEEVSFCGQCFESGCYLGAIEGQMPEISLYTQAGVMDMSVVLASQCACECGECGPPTCSELCECAKCVSAQLLEDCSVRSNKSAKQTARSAHDQLRGTYLGLLLRLNLAREAVSIECQRSVLGSYRLRIQVSTSRPD